MLQELFKGLDVLAALNGGDPRDLVQELAEEASPRPGMRLLAWWIGEDVSDGPRWWASEGITGPGVWLAGEAAALVAALEEGRPVDRFAEADEMKFVRGARDARESAAQGWCKGNHKRSMLAAAVNCDQRAARARAAVGDFEALAVVDLVAA